MAIQTIKATIQMRRGLEQDFDADQMTAGEWAVSTDKKYVRMCFAPGIVVRMATYEAFEADMAVIQQILKSCQDIQIAVDAMADLAEQHKDAAAEFADDAAESAGESEYYSNLSKSYAVGTNGEVRENDEINNAEYFYEQCKKISQSFTGIVPMGTITFEDLDNPDNQQSGYMFNISDSFVSDDRFQDGGGIFYGAGNNVIYTADGKWDVLAAAMVSGVKGNVENEYRQGFVNLTPDNIGAFPGVVTVTEENTNLNDYTKSGFFYFSSTYKPINIPSGLSNGWLMVIAYNGAVTKQIFMRHGTTNTNDYMTYVRTNTGSNWSNWKRFAMGNDVTIATTSKAGIVKPDGKTITVSSDGTIVGAASGFTGTKAEANKALDDGELAEGEIVNITDDYDVADVYDSELSDTSENAVQNKVVTAAITTAQNRADTAYNLGIMALPWKGAKVKNVTVSNTAPALLPANTPTPWNEEVSNRIRLYTTGKMINGYAFNVVMSIESFARTQAANIPANTYCQAAAIMHQLNPVESGKTEVFREVLTIHEGATGATSEHQGWSNFSWIRPLQMDKVFWVEYILYDLTTGLYVPLTATATLLPTVITEVEA